MNRFVLALLLLTTQYPAIAQYRITGKVVGETDNNPLAFANISWNLYNDTLKTNGTISDEAGNFSINLAEGGKYRVIVQMIGYKDWVKELVLNADYALGEIALEPTITELEQIVVRAERSYLDMKPGKRVLHIGQDVNNLGVNLAEALEMVPSITTNSRGDVALRGSSNFRIFINGRPTNRESRSLRYINADAIDRVEVITNPSAKYDAEGISGIINVIFRKDRVQQFKLDAYINGTLPRRSNVGTNLSLGTKRLSFYANLSAGWSWYKNSDQQRRNSFTEAIPNTFVGLSSDGTQFQPSITAGLDFKPDSSSSLNIEANWIRWDAVEQINQMNQIGALSNVQAFEFSNDGMELEDEGAVAVKYERQLNQRNKVAALFSVGGEDEANLNRYNLEEIDLKQTALANSVSQIADQEQQRYYRINVDYESKFSKSSGFELGSQYDFTRFEVVQDQSFFGNTLPDINNTFLYKVWKPAIYGLYKFNRKRWNVELGLRAESFQSDALQVNLDSSFQQQFFNVFPSFGLIYKVTEAGDQRLGINYSRRINTPGFFDINPLIIITDPLNLSVGNPTLRPEFSDLSEISYLFITSKWNLDLTLFYNITKDIIQPIVNLQDNQQSLSIPINFGVRHYMGTEVQVDYQPNEVLKFNQVLSWNYSVFNDNRFSVPFNRLGAWQIRLKQRLNLPNDWVLNLAEYFRSARIQPQSKDLAQYYIDLGLQKRFANGRGVFSVNIRDLFNTRVFRLNLLGEDFSIENRFKFQTRRLTAGLKYSFRN